MPAQAEKRGCALLWVPLLLGATLLGVALGGAGVYFYLPHFETPPPRPKPESLRDVVARGRIEPRDGVLSLGVPTPDRIRQIKVHEGDLVKNGDALAVLDSEVMRKLEQKLAVIQLDQAKKRLQAITESGEAQIRVEEARRDQIEQVEPLEIETLKSKIDYLQAQERNAQKDYKRYVAAGDTIAEQDKDKQELARGQVQMELIAARCHLEKLRKSSTLNRRVASAQLEAARAELKQSQSAISRRLLDTQVSQANERLKETQVHAPSDGKILRIFLHEGELVHAQPILQMANVNHMIVRSEVYVTDIPYVEIGQRATITSRIFKDKEGKYGPLTGKVVWIAGSVGKAQVTPLDPRAAVDNRVVEVKIELEEPQRVAKLIGHQVDVEIDTQQP